MFREVADAQRRFRIAKKSEDAFANGQAPDVLPLFLGDAVGDELGDAARGVKMPIAPYFAPVSWHAAATTAWRICSTSRVSLIRCVRRLRTSTWDPFAALGCGLLGHALFFMFFCLFGISGHWRKTFDGRVYHAPGEGVGSSLCENRMRILVRKARGVVE